MQVNPSKFLAAAIAVMIGATLGSAVRAQTMSLAESIEYALANNPGLHASEQLVEAAAQQRDSAVSASAPVITLSHSARVSDNPLDAFADKLFTRQVTQADFAPAVLNQPGYSDLYLTSLTLKWPVYTGGKHEALQQQSDIGYQQSRLQHQRVQQQVVLQTMQSYLYVVAAAKAMTIANQAVAAARQHADTTAALAAQGRIVESDKLSAEVSLAAVLARQAQALTRHRHALTRLRQVLGMRAEEAPEVDADWPQHAAWQQTFGDDLAALIEQALLQREDLKAAQKAVEAAIAGIEVASADNKPSISLVASSNWYDDSPGFDSQSSSLMAVASINLYDGTTDGRVGAARARQKELQWREQELRQLVVSEVRQAFDAVQEAQARLAIAGDNVARARESVRLVKKRYGQGRTILLDLLQSERMYTEARIEKLTAELNLRSSRLALAFAVGKLSVDGEVTK